jgi:hypothetical protein
MKPKKENTIEMDRDYSEVSLSLEITKKSLSADPRFDELGKYIGPRKTAPMEWVGDGPSYCTECRYLTRVNADNYCEECFVPGGPVTPLEDLRSGVTGEFIIPRPPVIPAPVTDDGPPAMRVIYGEWTVSTQELAPPPVTLGPLAAPPVPGILPAQEISFSKFELHEDLLPHNTELGGPAVAVSIPNVKETPPSALPDPNDWPTEPEWSKNLKKEDKINPFTIEDHACFTGDCPHTTQADCLRAIEKWACEDELDRLWGVKKYHPKPTGDGEDPF